MTESDSSPKQWTEQEKADAYKRAHMLVRKRCHNRPEHWQQDAASSAYMRWERESRGAPVDRWVDYCTREASQEQPTVEPEDIEDRNDPQGELVTLSA